MHFMGMKGVCRMPLSRATSRHAPRLVGAPTKEEPPYLPVSIQGRDYICEKQYRTICNYTADGLHAARVNGLPYVEKDDNRYYNEDDCAKWHMGG